MCIRDRAYIKINGLWVPEQQHFLSLGYVKVGGQWVSELQLEASTRAAENERLENDRKERLKKWQRYVLPKEDPSVVRKKLLEIVDPISVAFVESNYLKREDNPAIRALYIEAIGQAGSGTAQRILVQYLMTDPDQQVREQAIVELEQSSQFDSDRTSSLLSQFLRSADNRQINQAANYIERLDSEAVLLPLIGALKTTHTVSTGNDPGRLSTSFSSNGNSGLKTGGAPTREVERENEGVLEALEEISKQRFGYDEQAWRQWYVSEYSVTNRNLRRTFDE